mmetsp:Transcript_45527/g.95589  ORF Transcript_45527/g.95589 Transcript_45527/m.95589 type:complete len:155 (+) Transcript_45527:310-774(+)
MNFEFQYLSISKTNHQHSRNDSLDSVWSMSTQDSSGSEYSLLSKLSFDKSNVDASESVHPLKREKCSTKPEVKKSDKNKKCSGETFVSEYAEGIHTDEEHIGEKFVSDMKFEGYYYTGQVDSESDLPHGSGKLITEDGTTLEAEWKWGCCSLDV